MRRFPETKKWNDFYLRDERDTTIGKQGLRMSEREWLDSSWQQGEARIGLTNLKRQKLPLRILEFGCGSNGAYAVPFSQKGVFTVGIDISKVALRKLKARACNINICLADVTKPLPFVNDAFDGVFSSGVILHINFNSKCLNELLRVVKPGGIIQISSFQNKYHPEHILYYIINKFKLRFHNQMIFHRFYSKKEIKSFGVLPLVAKMEILPRFGLHPFYSSFNYCLQIEKCFKWFNSIFLKKFANGWMIQIEKKK